MLFSLISGAFIFLSIVLGFLIFLQRGKGDMGLGGLSGGTQVLFGGSGGQTFFEKLTWVLGLLFMLGALSLTVLKMRALHTSRVSHAREAMPTLPK